MKTQRFKTKEELTDFYKTLKCYTTLKANSLFGLPWDDKWSNEFSDYSCTTDPHPFDTIDIKVRVTPKQCRKLVKKAEKLGYVKGNGANRLTDGSAEFIHTYGKKIHWMTSREGYFNDGSETELTYKQFQNGTVPKKKDKPFEVGDWVENVSGPSYGGKKIGFVSRMDGDCMWVDFGSGQLLSLFPDQAKHTTKPKEQPLMFKGHEVKKVDDMYTIGYKKVRQSELELFYKFNKKVLDGNATADEAMEFMEANKSKLGL